MDYNVQRHDFILKIYIIAEIVSNFNIKIINYSRALLYHGLGLRDWQHLGRAIVKPEGKYVCMYVWKYVFVFVNMSFVRIFL